MTGRQGKQVRFNRKELDSLLSVFESYSLFVALGCIVTVMVCAAYVVLRNRRNQRGKQHVNVGIDTRLTKKTEKVAHQKRNRRNAKSTGNLKKTTSKIPKFKECNSLEIKGAKLERRKKHGVDDSAQAQYEEDGSTVEQDTVDSLLEYNKNVKCEINWEKSISNQGNDLNEGSLTLDGQRELHGQRESLNGKILMDNVNEFEECQQGFQGHHSDCQEPKNQEVDYNEDNVEFTYKKSLKHEHPQNNQEYINDNSEFDSMQEQKMDNLNAGVTSAVANYKKTNESNTEVPIKMLHEDLHDSCHGLRNHEQQCSDLPKSIGGNGHCDGGMDIQREKKCHQEENWEANTGTEITRGTTINHMQSHKDAIDHYETINDTSDLKLATEVSEKQTEHNVEALADMNTIEETMNNNEGINLSSAQDETGGLGQNLNDLLGEVGSELDRKSPCNSRSSLMSFDGTQKSNSIVTVQPMSHTVNVSFYVQYVTHSPFQALAVTGNKKELGSWKSFVQLQQDKEGHWCNTIALPVDSHVEWKFVLVENDKISQWEECENRCLLTGQDEDVHLHKWWGYI